METHMYYIHGFDPVIELNWGPQRLCLWRQSTKETTEPTWMPNYFFFDTDFKLHQNVHRIYTENNQNFKLLKSIKIVKK